MLIGVIKKRTMSVYIQEENEKTEILLKERELFRFCCRNNEFKNILIKGRRF